MKQSLIVLAILCGILIGCSQPMGAQRVTQDQACSDISGSLLSTGELSSETKFQLHRYGVDQLLYSDPDAALAKLQAKAIYAYLFLFSPNASDLPVAFDRRFRSACDLYNFGLGWALTRPQGTSPEVHLTPVFRQLPAGGINLTYERKAPA